MVAFSIYVGLCHGDIQSYANILLIYGQNLYKLLVLNRLNFT